MDPENFEDNPEWAEAVDISDLSVEEIQDMVREMLEDMEDDGPEYWQ